jgi:hypothetical protein
LKSEKKLNKKWMWQTTQNFFLPGDIRNLLLSYDVTFL